MEGTQLAEKIAKWAVEDPEVSSIVEQTKPLVYHFYEVSGQCVQEVLIAVAKALIAGYYLGRYGFPKEEVPEVFEEAFKEENNG